tara:strand:- start:1978 stop:2415 length:438 start_codon:yes stop_codon:yes gene_type:complete
MSNNIREDGGSSKLKYNRRDWDQICKRYFKKSNFDIENFHGDVLYIGMGNAYGPRNQSKNVKTTTILEKYPEIIKKYNDPSQDWNVIQGCAYDYDFKNQKFDIIMIDIFAKFIYLYEYNKLLNKYEKHLKDNGRILTIKTLNFKK